MTARDDLALDAVVRRGSLAVRARLTASPGSTVVVVGPNGAGKSTLLRVVAGLTRLDGGRLLLGGRVLDDPAARVFVPPQRRDVGVVFQDDLLFGHMTVRDNVAFGPRARGLRKAAAARHADELLERLDLTGVASAPAATLSGGQAQRAALARAIATDPSVLLLDEPLSALDAAARVDVRRLLREHLAGLRAARVLVTHDPLDALTLGDHVVVLEHGTVTQEGTPDELRLHPRAPYVAQLLGVNAIRGDLRPGGDVHLASGAVLHVTGDAPPGPCLAVIDPTAVTLFSDAPHASARNTWRATVADLDREPHRVRVRFDDPVPIVADVTPGAVAELGIMPGRELWCAVKATAITVVPV